jgi:putative endopeptidase
MTSPIDPILLDRSVKPTDDFFRFVNQRWIDENPIPPEESRWGSFYILRVEVEKQLKRIFETLSAKLDADVVGRSRKVRDFYRTGMDAAKRNAQSDGPLAELFAIVDAAKDTSGLSRALGVLHRNGIDAWWSPQAEADAKQSDVVAFYFNQAGLGLPDRDYYVKDDAKSGEIREKYTTYMESLLTGSLAARGATEPRLSGASIMDIETKLAISSMTRVELRDIEKQYNKFTQDGLAKLASTVDWTAYFGALGVAVPDNVIVCQPNFMAAADRLFKELPIETHQAYLRWHILNGFSHCLDEGREKARFEFYGRTFSGATEMRPIWRRVQSVVSALLDEAVAELYVEAHFGGDAKKKIGELVSHLSSAYRARIQALDWMGDGTKQKAIMKLEAISRKLGYPDVWKDIENMKIGTDSYVANVMCAQRFEFDRKMKRVGGPVDRSEWCMAPQTVNACYNPLFNEILFPAAILQPPFFDPDADDAMNFGGIGTVIGHELTHGFDDQGALFDAKGNLASWWTKEDKERFDARTERLAKQYDKFEAAPGLFVNGKLTLGENIADLGGLLIAYDGLMLAFKEKGGASETIGGFSPAERFFISYAVTERSAIRDEALRSQVQIDPHSPSPFRVNGPLSNLQEFIDAFRAAPGDKLWRDPEDRVRIW